MDKYIVLTEALQAFIKAKEDWDDEMFLYPADSILNHVRNSIHDCPDCEYLLIQGKAQDMDNLREIVAEKAIQMLPITLQNILFLLYTRARQGLEYSTDVEQWFRDCGWNFAPIQRKQEDQEQTQQAQTQIQTQPSSSSLNSNDETKTVKVFHLK